MKEALNAAGITKQTPDQRARIDAVLFALWAQGHRERSKATCLIMLPISWFAGGLVSLLNLPAATLRRLPEIAFAALLAILVSAAFDGIGSVNIGAVFLAVLLLLLSAPALRFIRNALFDIGDLIALGALSRRYAERHLAIGPLTVLDGTDGFKEHLFTSRVLTDGPFGKEANAFQAIVASKAADRSKLQSELDGYWRRFPVEKDYWRQRLNSDGEVSAPSAGGL